MLCRHHQCHEHFRTRAAHLPHMALASGRTAPPFEVRNVRSPVCWAIAQQNLKWCSSATSACYGQNISKSVRVLVGSLVVLVPKCAKSSRCRCCGSIRRAVPKATETAENSEAEREAAWHRGCSSSSDMAEAISEVVAEWQQSFGRSQVGQVLKQLRDPREISDGHPSPGSPSSGTTGGLEPSAPSPWHKLSKPVQIKQIFVRPLSFFLIKVPHSGWEKTAIVFWIFWPPCWLLILFCCGFYSRFALFVFYLC